MYNNINNQPKQARLSGIYYKKSVKKPQKTARHEKRPLQATYGWPSIWLEVNHTTPSFQTDQAGFFDERTVPGEPSEFDHTLWPRCGQTKQSQADVDKDTIRFVSDQILQPIQNLYFY